MTAGAMPCPRCNRATSDGLLCTGCVATFERSVVTLASLLPELATTIARLDNVTRAIRHRRPGPDPVTVVAARENAAVPARLRTRHESIALVAHALPVNVDAVDLQTGVQFTLATWVGHLRARWGDPDTMRGRWWETQRNTLAGPVDWCAWLLGSVDNLRRDDAAGAIVTDLTEAARRVELAIDRSDPDMYVGPCDALDLRVNPDGETVAGICGVDMWARLGDRHVTCTACGHTYPVASRKRWLLDAAREVWARPVVIAQALAAWDVDVTAARLDTWISRDKTRHQRDCVRRRPIGPRCPAGCGHDSCEGARLRPWECHRGHIIPVCDDNGQPVSDRPMYRVGDVLDRVQERRAAQRRRARRQAELEMEAS